MTSGLHGAGQRYDCLPVIPAEMATTARRGIARGVALGLIRTYQMALSPLFAGSCRFTPSCSAYAAGAIERFGVVRGTYLAARRLARCHPFGSHGVDPVPELE